MATKTETKVDEPAGFDRELKEVTRKFRGRTYVIREVPISVFDKITEQATKEIELPDGTTEERLDQQQQTRMLLDKAIASTEPPLPHGGISQLGTGVYGALVGVVRTLHFSPEPDELEKTDEEEIEGKSPRG